MFDHLFDPGSAYGADVPLPDLDSIQWSADHVFSPWAGHDLPFAKHNQALVGTPDQDATVWQQQQTGFTCDVVSQEMILHQFGIGVSEAQLVYDATSHGWLTDHGTTAADMGRLLEYYGIDAHQSFGNGIESIVSELAQGHKVIASVDSGDLWQNHGFFEELFRHHGADHAVVVTGLDMSDPAHPHVCINDPGDPGGAGKEYPLDQFLHAWGDGGEMFVATDHAPPDLSYHSILGSHFDQQTGMYMNTGYWSDLLVSLFPHFDKETFHSLLVQTAKGVAYGVVSSAVDSLFGLAPAWDQLDDSGRNDLFINSI